MAVTSDRLYVTYVDAYNGLLKIWGQPNRTCATYIEKQLLQLVPEFSRSSGPLPANVRKGMFCFAKYEDDNYYRARVISDVLNNAVLVFFIDYGNKDRIDLSNIRILNSSAESIITTIVPQAEEYYLANIKSEGGWSQDVINDIRRGLCYSEYKYRTVCHSGNDKLIQISYRNEDYSSFLIRQDLAKPVSVKEQMMLLRSTFKNQTMEAVGNTFRSSGFNQHVPQPSNRDNFFMHNKVQHGSTTQEHLNQPVQVNQQSMLSQPVFTQPQNRSAIVNNERHFNVMNPPQKVVFNQSSHNPVYPEAKSTPVINTVVIEALANQLKQHLMKDQLTPAGESSTQGYVTQVLDVKTTHNVYISYIDDGPWSFSVQLVSNEHELNQLMDDLASYNFQPIKLPLVLGSPCIAKSRQYENYCRGVLVNITHSAVKVFFVDFGNTEDLPVNMLFEMPAKFFKFKTMSQKFALSGLQRVKPTEEIKQAFVDVVENELLILHVTNLEGENLPTCDLYLKDVNIKRILNEKLRQVKNWEPVQYPRPGEIENVLVTWVESAQKFYVQLKRREPELKDLKTELAKLGVSGEYFEPEEIQPGTICICFFSGDKNWYRAVITSVNATKTVTVFYVDYGNTEEVDVKKIKRVGCGVITKIKTQAIPCCLQGYENESPNSSMKAALTDLIFEKEFSLKVVSGEKDRMIVQLFDNGKDMSLSLKNVTFNSKPNPSILDTKDMTENYFAECDLANKKSGLKGTNYSSGKNGSDRTDSGKSRGKKDVKNEKAKADFLSWRSDESRKDFSSRGKEDSKNSKSRDAKEPGSETKNEKHDGSKTGRYGFKGKKSDNVKSNDKDPKNWEKNWRGTDSFGGRSSGGSKPKLGESISERMKRAARENEARGLKLSESMITKLPVKLENIALHGHEFEKKEIEIGSTEDVIVTFYVNPNEIYVQLVSSKEKFRDFMIDIHDYYSTKLPLPNKPKKGDIVVAKFQQDGVLYRAVVIETEPITVRYIDFGNEEISENEYLWPMDKKFLELESQCLKCTLPDLKPVASDTWPAPNSEIDKIFEYETYSCTFLKKLDDRYEVNLVVSGTGLDVRDELISSGFACSVGETVERPAPMIKSKIHTSMALDLMCGDVINIFISHIVDASEFYIQIKCSEVGFILEEINNYALKEEFGQPVDINKIKKGEFCMVNVDSDNWHRAEVIGKKETNFTIQLIDYGEKLTVSYEQVRPIPDDLVKYPPQAIKCSLFIDPNAMDYNLNEEFSACDKNSYAALFHEVSDQRLKLALYDLYGEKLGFLEYDEFAPAFIRPIAELPIISPEMQVIASHINSPKDIHIQLLNDATELQELTSSIANFYSDNEDYKIEGHLSEYELYAAKSVSDQSWYRAQLLSQTDESARMFYIDFGIAEEVPKDNLRKLDPSFYERYSYAKKVSLNVDYDDDSENSITDKLRQLIGKKTCTGYFVKVNDMVYAEFVVDGSCVTPQLVSGSVNEVMADLFKEYAPKKSGEGSKVFIAHVSHPGEFWVHEESISCELSTLQDKLQAACSDGVEKKNIEVGDVVGVLFKDKLWYRALVTSVKDNIVSIRFLDYGNTFDIDKSENKFILLDEELKSPPSFARKCSLKGNWKKNATSKFEDIVMNNEDTFTLINIDEKGDKVDLLHNGSSITEQLIKEGYGEKENDTVYITHINSPDDFYVQKESDQELFETILCDLLETSSMEDAVDVSMDELYCARYPDDDLWYRARVLTKDGDDVVVSFIDYGNCTTVTEIKNLPQKLKTLRPLATKCCLANENSDDTWSEAACKYFCKYLNSVPFKMEIVEQGSEINTIRLFTENGEDVSEMLVGLSEDVIAAKSEPIDNEIVFSEKQNSFVCQDKVLYTDSADSCPSETGENGDVDIFKSSDLPDKTPDLPKCYTEKIVPGWANLGENSIKDNEDIEYVKKVSHSEKIVPGCVTRGLSLEEVPTGNIETEEKLTQNSFSAPVTPSISKRQKQVHKKIEQENKPLPGSISNSNLLVIAQDKIAHDEKQVAANVNGTVKDIQD